MQSIVREKNVNKSILLANGDLLSKTLSLCANVIPKNYLKLFYAQCKTIKYQPYILLEGNQIEACVFVEHKSLKYNHQQIVIPFFNWPLSFSKDSIYLDELMNYLKKQFLHTHLFVGINSLFKNFAEKQQFKNVISLRQYCFSRHDIVPRQLFNISKHPDLEQLSQLFDFYSRFYNGISKRKLNDFKAKQDRMKMLGGDLIVNQASDQINAYAYYCYIDGRLLVNELVYRDINSALDLIWYLLSFEQYVYVFSSEFENYLHITKGKMNTMESVYFYCQDFDLFNRIFKINVNNLKTAWTAFNKPLVFVDNI